MSMMKLAATAFFILPFANIASASTTITTLDGSQGWTVENAAGGNSQLVNLAGQGGNLENNQPAPTGAVSQTTGASNSDKTTVSYGTDAAPVDFGTVSQIFNSALGFGYSYYKASGSTNPSAAPSLKLAFYNPNYSGDGYGQLVYEPYWQQSGTPPVDEWQNVSIDLTHGLFWTTGMFGLGNTAGGPPLKTLAGWLSAFDSGFGGAELYSVAIGIGSYNQDQTDFFDNVSITGTKGPNGTYDFQAPSTVPVPATMPLLLGAIGGLVLMRRRKSKLA